MTIKSKLLDFIQQFERSRFLYLPTTHENNSTNEAPPPKQKKYTFILAFAVGCGIAFALLLNYLNFFQLKTSTNDYPNPPIIVFGDSITQVCSFTL